MNVFLTNTENNIYFILSFSSTIKSCFRGTLRNTSFERTLNLRQNNRYSVAIRQQVSPLLQES